MRFLRWIYAVAALIMLQSCLDDSYKGSSTDPLGENTLVPVRVAIGEPSGDIVNIQGSSMKGSGPIDNMNQVSGKDIYVYAFNRDLLTSYAKKSEDDMVNTLVDASIDKPGSRAGKRAKTRSGSVYLDWVDAKKELYYHSGDMSRISYDFFAYYLDDMQVSETDYKRDEHSVSINVQIDGRQDLMSAKAEIDQHQLAQCTDEERIYIKDYCYSYYTGIRNILPKFVFLHHLTRLEFELFPGETTLKKIVSVQSVKINSKYKGEFTVADKSQPSQLGLSFNDERKDFTLREKNGEEIKPDTYNLYTIYAPGQTATAVPIGGGLLVAPQDMAYEATLTLKETQADGTVKTATNTILVKYTPAPGEMMFAAGNQYKVKFMIYGVNDVGVNVTLEEWADGGKLDVDTEYDKPDIK